MLSARQVIPLYVGIIEEGWKQKVVESDWWAKFVQFLAALVVLPRLI